MTASPQLAMKARRRSGFYVNVAWVLSFCALVVLILNPLFGSLAVLIFLASGLALIAIRPDHSLYVALRYWPVLCLPAYCILSTLWSEYPAITLRHAIQLAVTCVIAIVIANRVPPVVLQRFLFAIYGVGVFGSLAFGQVRDDIGAWIGIFGSKNAFAGVISVFILAALTVLIDRSLDRLVRFVAFGSIIVSVPLLALAQSAGAIVVLVPAVATILLIHLSRFINIPQRLFFGLVLALIGAAGLVFITAHGDVLLAQLLDVSGKSTTLTGRTDLWEIGIDLIGQRPMLGVGYQAFWVQGNAQAEALWAAFGIETRQGFNFHNVYISNGVEIGLLGVALQVAMLFGGLMGCLLWAFRRPSPENAFYSAFLVLVAASSFVEVGIFFQFSVTSILVICMLVHALQADEAWKAHVSELAPARRVPRGEPSSPVPEEGADKQDPPASQGLPPDGFRVIWPPVGPRA